MVAQRLAFASQAESIALALDGRKVGPHWVARCPVCRARRTSLVLSDGDFGLVVRCQAGCTPIAIVRELARRRDGAP